MLEAVEAEHHRQKAMELEGAQSIIAGAPSMIRKLLKWCLIGLVLVTGIGAAAGHHAPTFAAPGACHVQGSGDMARPDDQCTPGTFNVLSRAEACAHKQRPQLTAADRRRIVRQYGYRNWSGRDGELDHRVPFFLGGRTEEDNLWPEAGPIPNRKDRLEFEVYDRVCVTGSMTVEQARAVFLGDWTEA